VENSKIVMKKTICIILTLGLSMHCHSNEWIAIGNQPKITNTKKLESDLWTYLDSKKQFKFEPKETYRFQYIYINKSTILINALCIPEPQNDSDPGTFPGPTTEELAKELYEVYDGGSCFFNIKYNIKKSRFNNLSVNGSA
jgi:hypothetical protein